MRNTATERNVERFLIYFGPRQTRSWYYALNLRQLISNRSSDDSRTQFTQSDFTTCSNRILPESHCAIQLRSLLS